MCMHQVIPNGRLEDAEFRMPASPAVIETITFCDGCRHNTHRRDVESVHEASMLKASDCRQHPVVR
eukprot:scaffold106099_cov19-Prasinocladus_malaysianus.AAC.1